MPNHVDNTLTVTGPEDDVRAFHAAINLTDDDNSGIIRAFIPFPKVLEGKEILNKDGESVGRAFTDDGYSWCLKNWGTKWGDYDTQILYGPEEIRTSPGNWGVVYQYFTAWSPADAAIATIAKHFPNLTFEVSWEEEGYQSCGSLAAKGECVATNYIPAEALPEWPDWNNEDETEEFYQSFTDTKDKALSDVSERLLKMIQA